MCNVHYALFVGITGLKLIYLFLVSQRGKDFHCKQPSNMAKTRKS